MSQEGGSFRSHNFTSNETAYWTVVDKMRQLGTTGGAYVGVGPEQNFTYLAKVRPRVAFLVDIRRQAIIQHLMYKAIFYLSPTRARFRSLLLSRPIAKEKPFKPNAPIDELLAYFSSASADEKAYAANLASIKKIIETEFQFPLSAADRQRLDYVYQNFRTDGLEISYRLDNFRNGYFPTLKEILAGTDLHGKQGGFLASKDDFEFMRGMHRKNLLIPVVGDFAGPKALAAVGDFLRKYGLTVTGFYTSNFEQYLFQNAVFPAFAANVKKLPIDEKSLPHPARLPVHRAAVILQRIAVFIKDFDAGVYQSYSDMATSNFIAADPH